MQLTNDKMDQILLNFLARYVILSEEEQNVILDLAIFKSFRKGTILLKEGQLSKDAYFVLKGCIRCY